MYWVLYVLTYNSNSLTPSLSGQEQKTKVKKSYQRLLRILDYLEETLLRGHKENLRLHQTVQKGVSSNIIETNQQLADNDNI